LAGDAPIIAVISSNFVQRGEPAVVDKDIRTRMALACGVDLVLELPVVFSSHNAGVFANAAVDILNATGVVSHLSFGMENPDLNAMERLADILNFETPRFKSTLKNFLRGGHSFVQARSMALDKLLPGSLELLKRPNNNIALAYVKRLREKGYAIEALAVERIGAGFHDGRLQLGSREAAPRDEIASAGAIRKLLRDEMLEDACSLLPPECVGLLERAVSEGRAALSYDMLWRAVKQAVLRAGAKGISKISEMSEGLENRMFGAAFGADSFGSFVDSCSGRRYTKGRIQRHCMHLLINLTHDDSRDFQLNGPQYIRVLGAGERGRKLLAEMRASASLPVISRASASGAKRRKSAKKIMDYEHVATEIWETLTRKPRAGREARLIPVMREMKGQEG
jgi:predicted nucleotidyltransferase